LLARRKAVLPLISRRWARVLRGPSHAWRDVFLRSFTYDADIAEELGRDPEAVNELVQETERLENAATALAHKLMSFEGQALQAGRDPKAVPIETQLAGSPVEAADPGSLQGWQVEM